MFPSVDLLPNENPPGHRLRVGSDRLANRFARLSQTYTRTVQQQQQQHIHMRDEEKPFILFQPRACALCLSTIALSARPCGSRADAKSAVSLSTSDPLFPARAHRFPVL